MAKEYQCSAQAVAPVYKKWPSSSSSVQVVSKLVHMLCTNWALSWAHVYISKEFPSLGTLSVTAWTQLVHICEQVSFQVGHSNFYSSATNGQTIKSGSVIDVHAISVSDTYQLKLVNMA